MDIKEMTVEQLEERKAAIAAEIDNEDADLDALEAEARAIKEEIENRKAEEAKKVEIRAAVASGEGETTKTFKTEEKKEMTIICDQDNPFENLKKYKCVKNCDFN